MKNDLTIAMKWSLLSGGNIGMQSKTENDSAILFPEILKELLDYVNYPTYQLLIKKEQDEFNKKNK